MIAYSCILGATRSEFPNHSNVPLRTPQRGRACVHTHPGSIMHHHYSINTALSSVFNRGQLRPKNTFTLICIQRFIVMYFPQDFHFRLDNLLRTLVHAKPHFIRCVRPNETESSSEFDRSLVSDSITVLSLLTQ